MPGRLLRLVLTKETTVLQPTSARKAAIFLPLPARKKDSCRFAKVAVEIKQGAQSALDDGGKGRTFSHFPFSLWVFRPLKRAFYHRKVARPGIEPGTRGFSFFATSRKNVSTSQDSAPPSSALLAVGAFGGSIGSCAPPLEKPFDRRHLKP